LLRRLQRFIYSGNPNTEKFATLNAAACEDIDGSS